MRTFFDTNILVYMFDADAPEKKEKARARFETEVSKGRILLSTQVLQEFYVTVTKKLSVPLEPEPAESVVRNLAALPILGIDAERVIAAIGRSRRSQFSFWDALVIETALAGGANRLLTEDLQHGQIIDGLHIENPFLAK
jgi:predicted nucleic acid-binding protein